MGKADEVDRGYTTESSLDLPQKNVIWEQMFCNV
jgi:hypothetical protein